MFNSFAYLLMLLPTCRATDRILIARDLVGPMRSPILPHMLHLTLLELANLHQRHLQIADWMRAILADHQLRACTFALGRLVAKPGIAVLEPVGRRLELMSLRASLASTIAATGFPTLWRKDFAPHVTLGRGISGKMRRSIDPIFWNADRIALVESWRGETHYEILETWPLLPPAQRSFDFCEAE
jgi:2'-5' RNA ligase